MSDRTSGENMALRPVALWSGNTYATLSKVTTARTRAPHLATTSQSGTAAATSPGRTRTSLSRARATTSPSSACWSRTALVSAAAFSTATRGHTGTPWSGAMADDTHVTTIRLPKAVAEKLELVARVEDHSFSEELRLAVAAHIEERRSDPAFMERLHARIAADRAILERLATSSDTGGIDRPEPGDVSARGSS